MSLSHSGTSLFISASMGTNLTTGTQKPHKCYCIVILESINSGHRAFGPVGIRTNESSLLRLSPQLSNGARQSYIHLLWVVLCLHVHTDTHTHTERERERCQTEPTYISLCDQCESPELMRLEGRFFCVYECLLWVISMGYISHLNARITELCAVWAVWSISQSTGGCWRATWSAKKATSR